jgi:diguanylate cyclase (GGDEF)-like protein
LLSERLEPRVFLALVSGAGLCVFATALLLDPPDLSGPGAAGFWMLAAFVILGELLPIRVARKHDEVTVSTTFAYALLLVAGAPAAMLAQALGCIISDAWSRKGFMLRAFNLAEYTLSLAAAGAVLELLSPGSWKSGLQAFSVTEAPAVVAAAIVYFLANNTIVAVAQARLLRVPPLPHLARDFGFHAAIEGMLLGLVPIVVVVERHSLWLLPLLAIPIVAVYTSGKQAVVNEHQATHDSLTDLPNRSLFRDRGSQAILRDRRTDLSAAVLIMDLDHFKEVNDTLGHHHGDLLLKRIGPALEEVLRSSDTVARLGGDEFAILLPGLAGPGSAIHVAEKVLERLGRPFVVDGSPLHVGASIGIACFPSHGDDVDTLIQRADVAMYWAKAGGTGCEIYSPEQDRYTPERLALAAELRRALERPDELLLLYQPKIDLQTGMASGVEALVRWDHPRHGLLPPGEFIAIAERTGLIHSLTSHVLEGAVRQSRAWQDAGIDLKVAVNLSNRTLLDESLPDHVSGLLARHGVAPGRLELEITESTIMADPVRATAILDRLSAMGIRLAIDDFGTGYSSLSQLKRLPVHEIKIDKSFVLGMRADKDDAVIVQSTIDLGRNLGLNTVAEGVEDEATLSELSRLGCDFAQGYHMSRPISSADLGKWLQMPARLPGPVGAGAREA